MSRGVLAFLYYVMFPVFVVGVVAFYVALRVRFLVTTETARPFIARSFIHHGARLLFAVLRSVSLVHVTVDSNPRERRPSVIVANHPSMLDAMLLLSLIPNAVCIMKRSLTRVPIVSGFARAAGYIPQADAPEMVVSAADALSSGASIIIFPEGTRSPHGTLGEFRRGAARIAVEAKVPLELFVLEMNPVVLGRGAGWLRPPVSTVRYRAVRIAMGKDEMEFLKVTSPEAAREGSIQLTKWLEVQVRNSLSLAPTIS
jgi:1-acyl-sn-glycerol-3-phosphate acyltransferase